MRPPLKWVGGKRLSAEAVMAVLPEFIDTYYEGFSGGAAVFFRLAQARRFRRAVLVDTNPDLMNFMAVLRDSPELLERSLRKLGTDCTHDRYYAVRASAPRSPIARAARMLWLNRSCFNGLYRVNSQGGFNVPRGSRDVISIDYLGLGIASQLLQGVTICCGDYEGIIDRALPGDAVYFDPPYLPSSPTAKFDQYTADRFGPPEQRRLSEVVAGLARNGIAVVASNADVRAAWKLYEGIPGVQISRLEIPRAVNRQGSGRGKVGELLISHKGVALRKQA